MKTTRPRLLASLAVFLAVQSSASARPPTLDRLFPSGGQRGRTVEVTATGSFDHWPPRGWSDDRGIEVGAGKEKGALSIRVESDVKPGVHWIRLSDDEGATTLRPFLVGTLSEIVEKETDGPIALERSQVTINGRLAKRGDVDEFAVGLKKGQTLVAAVDANRFLASPMDAVLQIASSEGFVLAQNDDDRGMDPLATLEVPADGTFLVRIFAFPATADSSINFAGGDTYVYRLTVTTGGYLDHGYPLAVARSDPGQVEAHGWNVPPDAQRLEVQTDATRETASLLHPLLANATDVRVVSHPARVEQEPNDREHPQPITIPTTLTGRIAPAGDRDVFEFAARKGQALSFNIESRTLGTPLDPVLRVTDATGQTLGEMDDAGSGRRSTQSRDPQLNFTPPADGTYHLIVRDLYGHGGERFVYRLTAAVPEPDFQLTMTADRFTLTPGKPLSLAVSVDRKNGFKGTVEVRAEALPDGVESTAVRSESGKPTSGSVTLTLTAKDGAVVSGPFRVVGSLPDGSHRQRSALIPIQGYEATTDQPWLTVPKPPAKDAKAP